VKLLIRKVYQKPNIDEWKEFRSVQYVSFASHCCLMLTLSGLAFNLMQGIALGQDSCDPTSMSDTENTDLNNPPAPFRKSTRRGPFTTHNGPWYHWADSSGFRQGVRLQERHCNSRGHAHGGFLSSFADGLLATAVFRELNRGSVTVQLTTEFLLPAEIGQWVQGTAWINRASRSLAFVEACAWVGEAKEAPQADLVFTANAVFKLKEERPRG